MTDTDQTHKETWTAFRAETNMAPAALEKWLGSDDSKRVGWKGEDGKGSGESVGHASGKRIVEIKRKKKAELTDADYGHMAKVVGYIRRHKAQKPKGDVKDTDWRVVSQFQIEHFRNGGAIEKCRCATISSSWMETFTSERFGTRAKVAGYRHDSASGDNP